MAATRGNHIVPTSTVSQARLRLFQPTQRPTVIAREWVRTSWGSSRVEGRFGQRHADLIEAFLWCAEQRRESDDGALELLVDPARVRATLSDDRHSLQRIKMWITELRAVVIEIETPTLKIIGGVIDHVEISPKTRKNPLTRGQRHLWRVRINKAFAHILANDLPLHYDPAPIARLKSGISQAIARHILTHKNQPAGGWRLDSLIIAIGGSRPGNSITLRHRRHEVRADVAGLSKIGIVVDGDRVRRKTVEKEAACSTGPIACSTGPIACSTGPARAAPAQCIQDLQEDQEGEIPFPGDFAQDNKAPAALSL